MARRPCGSTVKWGPTIAAEAGELRSCLAYRSLSMNVISPGPASPTGRAERIATFPSPTKRPRTSSASCPTVATTRFFLSSLKGVGGDRLYTGSGAMGLGPVRSGRESKCSAIAIQRRLPGRPEMLIHLIESGKASPAPRASGTIPGFSFDRPSGSARLQPPLSRDCTSAVRFATCGRSAGRSAPRSSNTPESPARIAPSTSFRTSSPTHMTRTGGRPR